jgi:hypothetical protein
MHLIQQLVTNKWHSNKAAWHHTVRASLNAAYNNASVYVKKCFSNYEPVPLDGCLLHISDRLPCWSATSAGI